MTVSHRPAKAIMDCDALRHNLAVVRRYAPDARVMAVVKANAYGHGLMRVSHALNAAEGFAVMGIDEALALRQSGFRQKLLLLEGLFDARELPLALQYAIDVVVHCEEQLHMLENNPYPGQLEVHLKVNTGMNRLGIPTGRFWAIHDRLKACKTVGRITLMTHFANADQIDGVAAQLELFNALTGEIDAPRSMANSAAILRFPQTHADWVRPGIMLYGASPVGGLPAATFDLKPVMTLRSRIIAVQQLQAGGSAGYGHQFTAQRPTRIGIVACGYADGYPRHAPGGTPVAVCGKISQTLGRVSMDMLFADLTNIPEAGIGSAVELWGALIPVDAVAEAAGTTGYELLCAVTPRVPVVEEV